MEQGRVYGGCGADLPEISGSLPAGKTGKTSKEDRAQLMLLFNRDGFSGGYYEGKNGREMIALSNTKEKERESKEVSVKREALYQEW